jgi:hypothetical protein
MNVYQCINRVQAALSKTGISKDRTCQQGASFKFRGIDDVYNALSPLLADNGLCILPRMLARHCDERQSSAGKALFYAVVEAEFDFVSAEDGSHHTVRTFGEAMDSGDKATNKAMSAAYKYACMQAFSIPTEGDNDPDATVHEVAPRPAPQPMPDDVVTEWLDDLQQTGSVADLKTVFGTAWKAAGSVGDASAQSKFKAAYDRRLANMEKVA